METKPKKVRALGLCSGGLDSILSALVLRDQGVEVRWITFETPFFGAEKARKASESTGIPLRVERITEEYVQMLRSPRCGYGKRMNPCLDCHALMFRLAGRVMATEGYGFLFSGEVLGQRPMSQTRPSLRYVEKHSGHAGYILRPLSAGKLDPTVPETQGWVDRSRLLDFSGRSRKPQMALAAAFGVKDYPAPAGGCLLTDVGYSRRLEDLLAHLQECLERDFELLKYGRHFRHDLQTKIIVGRTRGENDKITALADGSRDTILRLSRLPGPVTLVPDGGSCDAVERAAAMTVRYSKARGQKRVCVEINGPGGRKEMWVEGARAGDGEERMI